MVKWISRSWQAQHFREVRYIIRGKRSSLARRSAAQGQVQISWQARRFGKVRRRFRGTRSTLARSGVDFAAGADFEAGVAPSKGAEQISWQEVEHERERE